MLSLESHKIAWIVPFTHKASHCLCCLATQQKHRDGLFTVFCFYGRSKEWFTRKAQGNKRGHNATHFQIIVHLRDEAASEAVHDSVTSLQQLVQHRCTLKCDVRFFLLQLWGIKLIYGQPVMPHYKFTITCHERICEYYELNEVENKTLSFISWFVTKNCSQKFMLQV